MGGFRPISCCNAVYKVVSKILARRLEKLLPDLVSNSQSAFVKGRLLVENVLLATEMVQGFGSVNSSPRSRPSQSGHPESLRLCQLAVHPSGSPCC